MKSCFWDKMASCFWGGWGSHREANTTHITYKDGMQLIHFPNNQMEKHYPDGSREVRVQ